MRIFVVAIAFAVTMGGLFLFENYKTTQPEQNYAKIVSNLRQTNTPSPTLKLPTKTTVKTTKPVPIQPIKTSHPPTSTSTPTPRIHAYYTSSSASAKYYYCDTDSDWKNLSKANLKQFSSPDELLKSYPNRSLHEACK